MTTVFGEPGGDLGELGGELGEPGGGPGEPGEPGEEPGGPGGELGGGPGEPGEPGEEPGGPGGELGEPGDGGGLPRDWAEIEEISHAMADLMPEHDVAQPGPLDSLDRVYDACRVVDPVLKAITDRIADWNEATPGYRDGLKSRERAEEKLADYRGNPRKLLDVAGSKVVFEDLASLYRALKRLPHDLTEAAIASGATARVVRFKDRFVGDAVPSGYRDVLMNVEITVDQVTAVVEFRLHLAAFDAIAAREHEVYERVRSIEAIAKAEDRSLTEAEATEIGDLRRTFSEQYREAFIIARGRL